MFSHRFLVVYRVVPMLHEVLSAAAVLNGYDLDVSDLWR